MSHLSILPTVLRDPELLVASLRQLGFTARIGGVVRGFADASEPVAVWVELADGECLGWRHQPDGTLALVGDLQRISRSRSLQALISSVTRRYAAHQAMRQAELEFAPGSVSLSS